MSRFSLLLSLASQGPWIKQPGQTRMADGQTLPVSRIISRKDLTFVAETHPIGPGDAEQAQANANAELLAKSHAMARLLEEALAVFDVEFERDLEISGGDFLEWFSNWRARVKQLAETR